MLDGARGTHAIGRRNQLTRGQGVAPFSTPLEDR
jgi:hypothetical protein